MAGDLFVVVRRSPSGRVSVPPGGQLYESRESAEAEAEAFREDARRTVSGELFAVWRLRAEGDFT